MCLVFIFTKKQSMYVPNSPHHEDTADPLIPVAPAQPLLLLPHPSFADSS